MSNLYAVVTDRCNAALMTQDPRPVLGDAARADALALLRQAAPSPEADIDLAAVTAVCWTFWLRCSGAEGDEQQIDLGIASATFGFLNPRVPPAMPLPEQLRAASITADTTSSDAQFAAVLGLVHGEFALTDEDLPHPEKVAALEQVRRWAAVAPESAELALILVLLESSTTSMTDPDEVTDERIALFRTALAAADTDEATRDLIPAALAVMLSKRSLDLRISDPARSAELAAQARTLTDEIAARSRVSSSTGMSGEDDLAETGESAGEPLNDVLRGLNLIQDIMAARDDSVTGLRSGSADHIASSVARLRSILPDIPEDTHSGIVEWLGTMLTRLADISDDPAAADEAVGLLRNANAQAAGPSSESIRLLANALSVQSQLRTDPEAAREAALLAGLAAADSRDEAGADSAFRVAASEIRAALADAGLNADLTQLERAKDLHYQLSSLKDEISPEVKAAMPALAEESEAMAGWLELVRSGHWYDLSQPIGDEQISPFRALVAATPPNHRSRPNAEFLKFNMLISGAVKASVTDPGRAADMLAEAESLARDIGAHVPADSHMALQTGALLAQAISIVDPERPRTPIPAAVGADDTTTLQVMRTFTAQLANGETDPATLLAASRNPRLPIQLRVLQGLRAAIAALESSGVDTALANAEEAYELLAGITDRGSDRASSESALLMLDGEIRFFVANVLTEILTQAVREDAGGGSTTTHRRVEPIPAHRGVCFTGPNVDRATALLERGRGLLLTRQLEAQADLSELQSSHPVLARRFERLAEQIAATPDTLASLRPHDDPPTPETDRTAWSKLAKLRASREMDELITLIRSKTNLAQFLRPLSAPRLRDLAADGPIAILNHPEFGYCDALVVTTQAITAVRLDVKSAEVEENARLLRDAIALINARDGSRPAPDRLLQAGTEVRQTLAWSWHKVVRPVLTVAGACDNIRDGGAWPQIWWVPTGYFNLLPLHAAQCSLADCDLEDCGRQDGPRGALDVAVSSYIPGLRTLAHARARAARRPSDEHRAVLVAADEDDLPGVEAAARYAAGLLGTDSVLVGLEATRSAVMHLLPDATWAHFGCHATSDSALPSSARLQLPSGEPVSVLEICRIQPNAARMAFLTACGTARSAERLSDESIHITSSFLIAGFPEAVGTLWEVGSSFTEQLTRDFYQRALGSSGGSGTEQSTAFALHHTIRELRRRFPERSYAWAAYVHAGA